MRILCAIDLRSGPDLVRHIGAFAAGGITELILVHIIDTGPRQDLEQRWDMMRRGPHTDPARVQALAMAEESAGQAALAEALTQAQQLGIPSRTQLERGKPEQVLVQLAQRTAVDLVVVRAREWGSQQPLLGPRSVGHTARFVLDHASCDVLLVRQDAH